MDGISHRFPDARKLVFDEFADATLPSEKQVRAIICEYEVDATADAMLAHVLRTRCGLGKRDAKNWLLESKPLWPTTCNEWLPSSVPTANP